jgi:hypothetical protein
MLGDAGWDGCLRKRRDGSSTHVDIYKYKYHKVVEPQPSRHTFPHHNPCYGDKSYLRKAWPPRDLGRGA